MAAGRGHVTSGMHMVGTNKSLGQHWLNNRAILEEIAELAVRDLEEKKPEVKKEFTSKYSYCCDVCEKTFPGSPNPVDFMRLTGKADYYRESRSKNLYICNDCALELSDVVDRWLLKKNPKLRKFPLNGGNNEEDVSDLS